MLSLEYRKRKSTFSKALPLLDVQEIGILLIPHLALDGPSGLSYLSMSYENGQSK